MRTAVASYLVTGVPLGGLRPSRRDGKPGLISGEARPLGPAPTLPVKAPVDALFGHRQHPRGPSHHLPVDARWGPRSADSLSGILGLYRMIPNRTAR